MVGLAPLLRASKATDMPGDPQAHRTRRQRSQLVQRRRRQDFEALMAAGYQEMAEEAAALVIESLPLQAAAAEGVWRWDEPLTTKKRG